jgi:Protein of unknown function (DUF2937)
MRRSLAILGGLALAVLLSQFPEYAQQYTQRLGGAVDELRTITTEFDSAATAAGLTRQQALAHYAQSPDSFLEGRGGSMTATFARYDQLSLTLAELRQAGPLQRLEHLPDYLDSDVGKRTLDDFQPALPETNEGLLYALAGLVLGYVIVSALISLLLLPFRRWSRRRDPESRAA